MSTERKAAIREQSDECGSVFAPDDDVFERDYRGALDLVLRFHDRHDLRESVLLGLGLSPVWMVAVAQQIAGSHAINVPATHINIDLDYLRDKIARFATEPSLYYQELRLYEIEDTPDREHLVERIQQSIRDHFARFVPPQTSLPNGTHASRRSIYLVDYALTDPWGGWSGRSLESATHVIRDLQRRMPRPSRTSLEFRPTANASTFCCP